jgi:hypothetical protein
MIGLNHGRPNCPLRVIELGQHSRKTRRGRDAMDWITEQLRKLGVDEHWPEATNDYSSARQQSGGSDLSPGRNATSHGANLTPQIFPCRQITSQLRVWPPSAKANSNRSGTTEGLVVEILAPPWEISITRHSASVRSCTLIDACMLRVRRTSRLMRFLSLGIGQAQIKSARFRRALRRRLLLATAGSHSGAGALDIRLQRLA